MIGSSIKHYTNKTVVTTKKDGETVREVVLFSGKEYIVNPINKNKLKHRGRKVEYKSYSSNGGYTTAKVKFLDNDRYGKVEIDDLDNIEAIDNQTSINDMEKLRSMFQIYLDILEVVDRRKDNSGITKITQKELADINNTIATNISKRIKHLIHYGAIEKINDGFYKILHNDIMFTPFRVVVLVADLINYNPELIRNYKSQASLLNVSIADIYQAWGYLKLLEN
ncbi:hypothetical protein V1503_19170 [Bacillus sp. SCS-151]|uniref:hypothetical protein n=1 Tax=Nanhaiella sioensis TaxID=3115293 RepID=UPI00397AD658